VRMKEHWAKGSVLVGVACLMGCAALVYSLPKAGKVKAEKHEFIHQEQPGRVCPIDGATNFANGYKMVAVCKYAKCPEGNPPGVTCQHCRPVFDTRYPEYSCKECGVTYTKPLEVVLRDMKLERAFKEGESDEEVE